MTGTDEIRTLIDGLAKALPSDWNRQHVLDETTAGLGFVLGRPNPAKFREFQSAEHGFDGMYNGTDDVYLYVKDSPGRARMQDAKYQEIDGQNLIWVIVNRNILVCDETVRLTRGEIRLLNPFDAVSLHMTRECRWATQDEIDRATEGESGQPDGPPEGGGRAADGLRSVRTALRLHSLPRARSNRRRGVSNKDLSLAPESITTKG